MPAEKKVLKNRNIQVTKNISSTGLSSRGRRRFVKLKRKIFKHVWVLRGTIIAGVIASLYLVYLGIRLLLVSTGTDYYIKLAYDFVFTPEGQVEEIKGRTNILILGKGGAGHEAPDLTDTMIFMSIYRPDTFRTTAENESSVTLISLPRDIWVPELRAKLNSVYFWGNQKQEGGGSLLAKSIVEKIVGQPIQYTAVVDFSGFKEIIDVLGGVEVEVENSFVDEEFPIPGKEDDLCDGDLELKCRYETVSFEKGRRLMDGETALKYVRSRHAEGDEGTDFARGKRQQQVISAIQEKVTSKEIITSPQTILKILDVVDKSTQTDIDDSARAILARYLFDARNLIKTNVLPEGLLEQPPLQDRFDNLYVFIPREKDPEDPSGVSWAEVHEWVNCVLQEKSGCFLVTEE